MTQTETAAQTETEAAIQTVAETVMKLAESGPEAELSKVSPYVTRWSTFPIFGTPAESGIMANESIWAMRILAAIFVLFFGIGFLYTIFYFFRQFYVFLIKAKDNFVKDELDKGVLSEMERENREGHFTAAEVMA